MASKVVEANAGVHSLSMAVAVSVTGPSIASALIIFFINRIQQPVTSWRLYGKLIALCPTYYEIADTKPGRNV